MKIATIVAAVALATGSAAFAADTGSYSHHDMSRHDAVVQHDHAASHGGFVERTKRALRRMGQKLRHATHTEHSQTAARDRNDTRSMGAAGDTSSEASHGARQERMNHAYRDYQHKQERRDTSR